MGGGSSKSTPGLCGLKNFSNTCYMNASVQCLSHTGLLTALIFQSIAEQNAKAAAASAVAAKAAAPTATAAAAAAAVFRSGTVSGEFVVLLRELWSGERTRFSPSEFKSAIDKYDTKFYGVRSQHDAFDFLLHMIDILHRQFTASQSVLGELQAQAATDSAAALVAAAASPNEKTAEPPTPIASASGGGKAAGAISESKRSRYRVVFPVITSVGAANGTAAGDSTAYPLPRLHTNAASAASIARQLEQERNAASAAAALQQDDKTAPNSGPESDPAPTGPGAAAKVVPVAGSARSRAHIQRLLADECWNDVIRSGGSSFFTRHFHGQTKHTLTCGTCTSRAVSFYCFQYLDINLSTPADSPPKADSSASSGSSGAGAGAGGAASRVLRPSSAHQQLQQQRSSQRVTIRSTAGTQALCPRLGDSDEDDSNPNSTTRIGGSAELYLEDRLSGMRIGEEINNWMCPNCKTKRTANQTIAVYKCPNILLFRLGRTISPAGTGSTGDTRDANKLTTRVSFPLENLKVRTHGVAPLPQFAAPPTATTTAATSTPTTAAAAAAATATGATPIAASFPSGSAPASPSIVVERPASGSKSSAAAVTAAVASEWLTADGDDVMSAERQLQLDEMLHDSQRAKAATAAARIRARAAKGGATTASANVFSDDDEPAIDAKSNAGYDSDELGGAGGNETGADTDTDNDTDAQSRAHMLAGGGTASPFGGSTPAPATPALSITKRSSRGSGGSGVAVFDLYAILSHVGSGKESGHYVAHTRHALTGQWHTFNDTSVEPLPVATDTLRFSSKQAYILLYRRRGLDPPADVLSYLTGQTSAGTPLSTTGATAAAAPLSPTSISDVVASQRLCRSC